MAVHRVTVGPFADWFPAGRLLGRADWHREGSQWAADLQRADAADLAARLHKLALCGHELQVDVRPSLKRNVVRAARTEEARRRRETTPGFTNSRVQLDEQGRFSLTAESLALRLGQQAAGRPVIDVFCGAGGNAIGFARAGSPVIAIELDAERLAMAEHNARIYGVADKIRFVEGDALELLGRMPTDGLLFADPPWGPDYRKPTALPDHPLLTQLAEQWQGPLWAKLPPAFDPTSWPEATPEAWFGEATGDNRRVKFLLLRRP